MAKQLSRMTDDNLDFMTVEERKSKSAPKLNSKPIGEKLHKAKLNGR